LVETNSEICIKTKKYIARQKMRGPALGILAVVTFSVFSAVSAIVGTDVSAMDSTGKHRCTLVLFCETVRRILPAEHYCAYANDSEGTDMACLPPVFDNFNSAPASGPLFTNQASCKAFAESVYGATADLEFMYVTVAQLNTMYTQPQCKNHPMYAMLQDDALLAEMLLGITPVPLLSSVASAGAPWLSCVFAIVLSSVLLVVI